MKNSQTPDSGNLVSNGAKVRQVRSYAESNPLTAAGIAFAAGVLLSALIRR